jgi:hypothetical protein
MVREVELRERGRLQRGVFRRRRVLGQTLGTHERLRGPVRRAHDHERPALRDDAAVERHAWLRARETVLVRDADDRRILAVGDRPQGELYERLARVLARHVTEGLFRAERAREAETARLRELLRLVPPDVLQLFFTRHFTPRRRWTSWSSSYGDPM